ncbi:MAG: hypothetical protein J6Q19_06900 [Bacteroidaceae bacterium]|nr:hypothetical protein [Bacteroidaceae bacterium]
MKKVLFSCFALLCGGLLMAQSLKVSVMGDSYSTFRGTMPKHYDSFYPMPMCKVSEQSQMWWQQFIDRNGYQLEKNDSYSGSTISNSGYNKDDYSDRAFVSRINEIGNPDILFIFGGTNDDWVPAPMGEYKYKKWTKEDLYSFRPAMAYLLHHLKEQYPNMKIYVLMNSDMKDETDESIRTICKKYKVPYIELHDIEKSINHPTLAGMTAIADQIQEFIDNEKK